jgi:6-phosphogluconolactonase/glucosamine-6-phosphate isomerase/deaminase
VRIAVFPEPDDAARYAARWVAQRLRIRAAARREATLAVSGGTTAPLFLDALAHADVPWKRVRVFQVDERVVPNLDPARNANQLTVLPLPRGQIVGMSVTLPRVEIAVDKYEVWLPERLDVVHLGLGDDGHTASWPPDDPVVHSPRRVALVGPFNGHMRVTLTPRTVNEARHRLLFVAGASKAEVLAAYVQNSNPSLPICRVNRTDTLVVADREAAALLDGYAGDQQDDD